MNLQTDVNALLTAEVERVGGGYLKIETYGDAVDCGLFVHEGSEIGVTPPGIVYWHRWDDDGLPKQELLDTLRAWPTYRRRKLDPRVGIWFAEYQRQKNRKTGALRWKPLGTRDVYYPTLFPWDDLENLCE